MISSVIGVSVSRIGLIIGVFLCGLFWSVGVVGR